MNASPGLSDTTEIDSPRALNKPLRAGVFVSSPAKPPLDQTKSRNKSYNIQSSLAVYILTTVNGSLII